MLAQRDQLVSLLCHAFLASVPGRAPCQPVVSLDTRWPPAHTPDVGVLWPPRGMGKVLRLASSSEGRVAHEGLISRLVLLSRGGDWGLSVPPRTGIAASAAGGGLTGLPDTPARVNRVMPRLSAVLDWRPHWFHQHGADRVSAAVGGPARLRVILILASVLALDSADKATVGASAVELERSLHIGNTQIGLLVSISTAVGPSRRCRSGR